MYSQIKDNQCDHLVDQMESTYLPEISWLKQKIIDVNIEAQQMRECMLSDISELQVFFTRIISDLTREINILRVEKVQAIQDKDMYKTENKMLH